MHYRPVEQVGYRGQTNVRVRSDIDVHAGLKFHRTEMIKKHEGSHRATCQGGQQSRNAKAAAEIFLVSTNLQKHGYLVRSHCLARRYRTAFRRRLQEDGRIGWSERCRSVPAGDEAQVSI